MKRVLVTGAGGFVGRALTLRLLADPDVERVTGIDQQFDTSKSWPSDPRAKFYRGDFSDPDLLQQALTDPVDVVFHLASVPGSLAEREPELGWRVNLNASLDLLYSLVGRRSVSVPRVVFASSVAVYGSLPPNAPISESAVPRPTLSYGAHKLIVETLIADLTRRGDLDGISVRLPGIVARPSSASGHGSAFMSELLRRLVAGEPYDCPVSPQARAWWMSLPCCLANLLHAARIDTGLVPAGRVVQLPVLTATVADLVSAFQLTQKNRPTGIRYVSDPAIEQVFGRFPPLETPTARALGFKDDGELPALISRATDGE